MDDSGCNAEELIRDNERNLQMCRKYDCNYILIGDAYQPDIML